MAELSYSKATRNPIRVVLAAPKESPIESAGSAGKRIATEYVRLTERYLPAHAVRDASVEFSWGRVRGQGARPCRRDRGEHRDGVEPARHNLRIVDTLLTSTTRLVANHAAWADSEKRAKIENMAMLLQGALNADALVGLKMNVAKPQIEAVVARRPALKRPTVSPLYDNEWVAVEIIIEEKQARDLIPRLRRAGAEGIVEYPLNKVIY